MKAKQKDFDNYLKKKCSGDTLAHLLKALKLKGKLDRTASKPDWGLAVVAESFGSRTIAIGAYTVINNPCQYGATRTRDLFMLGKFIWFKWNLNKSLYEQKPILRRNVARLLGFKLNTK